MYAFDHETAYVDHASAKFISNIQLLHKRHRVFHAGLIFKFNLQS